MQSSLAKSGLVHSSGPGTATLAQSGRVTCLKHTGISQSSWKACTTACPTAAAPAPVHQGRAFCVAATSRHGSILRCTQATAAVESSTVTETESSPARLTGEDATAWQTAAAELAAGVEGFDGDTQQKLLQRAFGWGKTSPFWRGSKVEEVPQPGQVQSVIAYLQSLGVTGPNLQKVVKTFPEVLGCSVSDQLEVSVKKLQSDWKLQGDVLMRAVVRQPHVLGYNVDCEGSCIGECNRCWARF